MTPNRAESLNTTLIEDKGLKIGAKLGKLDPRSLAFYPLLVTMTHPGMSPRLLHGRVQVKDGTRTDGSYTLKLNGIELEANAVENLLDLLRVWLEPLLDSLNPSAAPDVFSDIMGDPEIPAEVRARVLVDAAFDDEGLVELDPDSIVTLEADQQQSA